MAGRSSPLRRLLLLGAISPSPLPIRVRDGALRPGGKNYELFLASQFDYGFLELALWY